MPTFRETKAFGITGSIVLIAGGIGFGDNVPSLIALLLGLVLLLVTAKYLTELTRNDDIYKNMQFSIVFSILALIVGYLVVFAGLRSVINLGSALSFADFAGSIGNLAIGLLVVWLLFIAAGIFGRRSLYAIASNLREDRFRLAGRLLLVGAVLIVLFAVGLILIFLAVTVQLIAFFSLPDEMPVRPQIDAWGKPLSSESEPAHKTRTPIK
jgi:uncharacterized membrane protein